MKTQRLSKTFLSTILILLILVTGCSEKETFNTIYLDEAFSIVPYVSIYETKSDFEKHHFDIENECNTILQNLDNKFNVNKEDSMIMNVNNNAFNNNVIIDEEFYNILSLAISTSANVSEKYDPTIYSLSKLWDFKNQYFHGSNFGVIPEESLINDAKENVDYKCIDLNNDNGKYSVKFNEKSAKIDLGSIVKGYAADLLEEALKQYNVNNAIINIGGNIVTYGSYEYKVGITTPFYEEYNDDCNIIGYLTVKDNSYTFVTTGIYERYIKTSDGKMYHHILDKETGYPIDNELTSVTICLNGVNKSALADALSTSIYTLGLSEGLDYCKNNNIEAIFITKDKEIVLTDGLKNIFTYNVLIEDIGYKVKQ